MTILAFHCSYLMHGVNKNDFFVYLTLVLCNLILFECNPCCLSPLIVYQPWEGGPLLSFDGNMVGMNLFLTKRKAVFLPWGTLKHYMTPQLKVTGLAQSKKLKVHRYVQLMHALD